MDLNIADRNQVWISRCTRKVRIYGQFYRIIHGKIAIDRRYETIINFMRKSFPNFKDLVFDRSGPNTVYANFVQKNLQYPIPVLSESEGQLQMLILLTALFAKEEENDMLILFDEPETSLHPYAISVFAEAVKLATKEWNRQVFIATHSPVLISQFDPEDLLATGLDESGQTVLTRVSEMEDIQDLLEDYATGSLYMAEAIAPKVNLTPRRRGMTENRAHSLPNTPQCADFHFGLIVTGHTEEKHLPKLFELLKKETRICNFKVIEKIEQRSPRTSSRPRRTFTVVGTDQRIPTTDWEEIGAPAIDHVNQSDYHFVILIDDLEYSRKDQAHEVFERYQMHLMRYQTPQGIVRPYILWCICLKHITSPTRKRLKLSWELTWQTTKVMWKRFVTLKANSDRCILVSERSTMAERFSIRLTLSVFCLTPTPVLRLEPCLLGA